MAKKKAAKKKARRRERPEVERRIMFFRLDCGRETAGHPTAFDAVRVLRHINGLAWSSDGRYQPDADGTVVCSWVDRIEANQRMQLATVRRGALPLVEDGSGTLSSLNIPVDAGLAEITHMMFFPNNILGAVFNFFGPRPTRLAGYLRAKVPGMPPFLQIDPLIKANVTEDLDRLETIRLVDLKIRPSYAAIVEEADASLGAAFNATTQAVTNDLDEVQIVLRSSRERTADLGAPIRRLVRQLLGHDDLPENAKRFVVGGIDLETQRTATVDLLNDKLVCTKRIIKQSARSRALDNDSAYEAIQEAYNDLRDELETAAALEIEE